MRRAPGLLAPHGWPVLAVAAFGLLSCAGNGEPPTTAEPDLAPGRPERQFRLSPGERVTIPPDGLSITFLAVGEDSRCPVDENVDCFWEGDGAVALELATGRRLPEGVTLHTTLEPKAASFAGHEIRLVGLEPAPSLERPIPPEAYVATVSVEREP